MYKLGTGGTVLASLGWSAPNGRGAYNGDTCQMQVSVAGSKSFPMITTAQCYGSLNSSFGGENKVQITTPGSYTVTAQDMVSGATGTSTFTVEP